MNEQQARTEQQRLRERVDAIRRRILLRNRLTAAAWLAAVIVPALLVLAWMDWSLRGSHAYRWAALLVMVAAAVVVTARKAWPAWRRRPDRADVSIAIEEAHPALDARLLTAVAMDPEQSTAPSLLSRTVSQAHDLCRNTPLESVIDWRSRRGILASGALAVLVALGFLVFTPELAGIALARTLLPWAAIDWPSRARIELAEVPEHVRRGDAVNITGSISGMRVSTGTLRVRTADDARWRRVEFPVSATGAFEAAWRPALEDLTLVVAAGDNESEPRDVRVIIPPEVEAAAGQLRYRDYTGLEDEGFSDGNVEALIGTSVLLDITATSPLVRGELVFEMGRRVPLEVLSATRARAPFEVLRDERYEARLYDQYNYRMETPVSWDIHSIPDELPEVELQRPAGEKRVTPLSVLDIEAMGEDDFGIVATFIAWTVLEKNESGIAPLAASSGGRRARLNTRWDLAEADLLPGDQVSVWIEMGDEAPYREPDERGRSHAVTLMVMAPDALRELLQGEVEGQFQQLADIEQQAQRALDAITKTAAQSIGEADSGELSSAIRMEEWRSLEVSRRLETVANHLLEHAADLENSHLAPAEETDSLRTVARNLQRLSESNLTTIVEQLRGAREALESETF